jgi:hypothetical protein
LAVEDANAGSTWSARLGSELSDFREHATVAMPSSKRGSVILARVDTPESLSHVIIFGSIMASKEWQTGACLIAPRKR